MNSFVFTIWILVKLSKLLKYDWVQNVLIKYVSVVTSLLINKNLNIVLNP